MTAPALIAAAAYVRMSTDQQVYSIEHQMDAIEKFARSEGFNIVKIFSDEGCSGVTINHREGLLSLLAEVTSGAANFKAILVLDVSRWGRFQDIDEGAHYEYLCRQFGVTIRYVSEPLLNVGTDSTVMLLKGLKRIMAAEYSRDLSARVLAAQCRFSSLGFIANSACPLGFRRVSVDANRTLVDTREGNGKKQELSQKTVLVLGPQSEIDAVRTTFRLFVEERLLIPEIERRLVRDGIVGRYGKKISKTHIYKMLSNEKYIGNVVYRMTSSQLHTKKKKLDPAQWIRAKGACEAIVDPEIFARAQTRLSILRKRRDRSMMLGNLRNLLAEKGTLNIALVNACPDMPSEAAYRAEFGSLIAAYRMVGFKRAGDDPKSRDLLRDLKDEVLSALSKYENFRRYDVMKRTFHLFSGASIQIALARPSKGKKEGWYAQIKPGNCDFLLIGRPKTRGAIELTYYFLRFMDDMAGYYVFEESSLQQYFQKDLTFLEYVEKYL